MTFDLFLKEIRIEDGGLVERVPDKQGQLRRVCFRLDNKYWPAVIKYKYHDLKKLFLYIPENLSMRQVCLLYSTELGRIQREFYHKPKGAGRPRVPVEKEEAILESFKQLANSCIKNGKLNKSKLSRNMKRDLTGAGYDYDSAVSLIPWINKFIKQGRLDE